MAFKKPGAQSIVPESPDRLFRDLPRRKHASLFDHQGQLLRTYASTALARDATALSCSSSALLTCRCAASRATST